MTPILNRHPRRRGAFTLVELLVVIGIIALLISILMPALNGARKQAQMARELSAVRQLMTAFHVYAADNRGKVLPGYAAGYAEDQEGHPVGFPANARYPWRIMRYLNRQIRDSILVNEQANMLGERDYVDLDTWRYAVSIFPSFGMNIEGVGGNLLAGSDRHVRRLGEPSNPCDLIVFASARHNQFGLREGYFEVRRPAATAQYRDADGAHVFGFLHPRQKGRAVVGFFDGRADLLDTEQLKDPRHWQNARQLVATAAN